MKNLSVHNVTVSLFIFSAYLAIPERDARAQLIEILRVDASSTTDVLTQPLLPNVDYELTCRGTYSFWRDSQNDSVGLVDAAYYIDVPPGEFGNGLEPFPTTVTNGLLINGRTVTGIIGLVGVSATHTYVVPMRGNGSSVRLFIEDHPPFGVDRHADNTGYAIVEVRRISPHVSLNTRRIDFGDVLLSTSKDSAVQFHNSSRSGLLVTLSNIIGTHATDFTVLGTGSFTIYENQDSTVGLRFSPSAIGKRYGAVIFNTNDPDSPQVRVDLEGNGIAPSIGVSPMSIDFGEVELASTAETTIIIQNTGSAPLTVQSFSLAGTDPTEFSHLSPSPFILTAGQQQSVTIRFSPASIRRKDAALLIRSNASGGTTTIILTGVGVTTLTAGFSMNHRARAEGVVLIPVELYENKNGSLATEFQFLARYNYRILYPRRVVTAGSLSNTFNVQMTSPRVGVLQFNATNGQPLSGVGNLLFVEFLVLFGDTTYSPLIIDSLKFNDGNPRARMRNGMFQLDSACNQFLRQIKEVGLASLQQNIPNPFNPSTMITYSIPVDQFVTLSVFDMMGRTVRTLKQEWQTKGEHRVDFLASDLPSGFFYYELRTKTESITKKMLLVR